MEKSKRWKNQIITDALEQNYMPYAMSVIVSRAIPEIDGFKPSHRKLLYTMYKMGLLNGGRTKSANVVGQTMKLNPHGDAAIYETMVRLTRGNGSLIHPWIDSKGNFGRVYSRDMQFAASRYTEVSLDKSCETIFAGLDKNAVDFMDNYDGSMKEPRLLPACFPTILLNNNQGIAVGMASNVSSFNLTEVCEATVAYIENSEIDLLDYMPAPDFSTGAKLLYDREAMEKIYETGRGSFKLRSVYQVDKKNHYIEVLEIPYTTTSEAIIDDITALYKKGKIKEINDVRDETDLNGLKITIEYKRTADPELLMQKLMHWTSLESNFSCNFNILVDGSPRVMGVKEILEVWLKWRQTCIIREATFELEKKRDRLHLLQGLKKILLDIDKAIKIVRQTELEAEVVPNLMAGFEIDQLQAEYVAEIKLRHLNREYILQRTKDISQIETDINHLVSLIGSEKKINNLIIKQINDVKKKYGRERLTELVDSSEHQVLQVDVVIEDYRLKLFYTQDGYLKKIPLTSLRSAGDLKLKDDDAIIQEFETSNKTELLFFTNKANLYKLKTYDVNDHKPSEFGEYTPNLLELEEDEQVKMVFPMTEVFTGYFFLVFENGKGVIIAAESYLTKNNRKKLVNAFYNKSALISVFYSEEKFTEDFIMINNLNRVLIFNAAKVPVKATRTSQGVQIQLSKKGSYIVSCNRLKDGAIEEPNYYRVRNIPAAGYYLRKKSVEEIQISLDGLE